MAHFPRSLSLAAALAALLGASGLAQAEPTAPAPDPAATTPAATPADAQPPAVADLFQAAPGSIWNERSARSLLGQEGSTRQVGDLVTVNIYESTSTSVAADTTTSRDSSLGAKVSALFGIETSVLKANPNMGPEISMGAENSSSFAGSGSTRRESSVQGQLTCTIVEVLGTGNLRIRGSKEVRSNRETQFLVLDGVVRPRDIKADNTVDSYLLADMHIENSGAGVVADKQGPGLGQRLIDRIWPF